ncbi:tyrosine-protein phosphatase [Rhodococcus sp. HNM0569]|uniref:tyrosine-protein phosphatase n=1 Tax=Rhodococcus sp. HNM0569 TaxID=2716340 RepID=UPI001F108E08|nr:tyrosine-protein phosphatase [Rhodococcus sp. HNM0569]
MTEHGRLSRSRSARRTGLRATLVAGLAAGTLLAGTAPAYAAAPTRAIPTPTAEAAPWDAGSLHLEGVENARDLGGYATVDGRHVRTGKVLRTAALDDATPTDLARLTELGVTDVDDLRTVYERTVAPDLVPEGATANWYDALGGSPVTTLVDMPSAYRAFVTGPGANQAFGAVLRDLVESDGAVLYHCSAGKDRTGWTTAVLLTILGVPRDTIEEDYLLSNRYRGADPQNPGIDGVSAEWLDISFETVTAVYGDFDTYVRDGLGLSAEDLDTLRAKLLEA